LRPALQAVDPPAAVIGDSVKGDLGVPTAELAE
jgi:hypothetical protein